MSQAVPSSAATPEDDRLGEPPSGAHSLLSALGVVAVAAVVVAPVVLNYVWGPPAAIVAFAGQFLLCLLLLVIPIDFGRKRRFLAWVAVLFPQVRGVLEDQRGLGEADRLNKLRYADMARCLDSYRLAGADALADPPRLSLGEQAAGLEELSGQAATVALSTKLDPKPSEQELARYIRILHRSRFTALADQRLGATDQEWKEMEDRGIAMLARLVQRHEVFDLRSADLDEIEATLRLLRSERPRYDLAELLQTLRSRQTDVVADMRTIAQDYDLPSINDPGTISIRLAGVPITRLASEAQQAYRSDIGETIDEADVRRMGLLLSWRRGWSADQLWQRLDEGERRAFAKLLRGRNPEFSNSPDPVVEAVFTGLATFDVDLAGKACRAVERLHELTEEFVRDCHKNGIGVCDRWVSESTPGSLVELLTEQAALPGAQLDKLAEPDVAVDLLLSVAEDLLAAFECEASGPLQDQDLQVLPFVAVGLFLVAGRRYPDLAKSVAKHARSAGIGDTGVSRAAQILLARMWKRREQTGTGQGDSVPLADLLCNWETWLAEARSNYIPAGAESGDSLETILLANIGQQIRHGEWPTQLPVELLLEGVAERIVGQLRAGDDSAVEKLQQAVRALTKQSQHDLGGQARVLAEQVVEFDPAMQAEERSRLRAEITASAGQLRTSDSLRDLQHADEDLERVVHELAVTDSELVRTTKELVDADEELRRAVSELGGFELTTRRYLLTFRSSKGALSPLVNDLARRSGNRGTGPELLNSYQFEGWHAPYVRIGHLPEGMSFGAFTRNLAVDIGRVIEWRKKRGQWEPPIDGFITVQSIAGRDKIPLPARR